MKPIHVVWDDALCCFHKVSGSKSEHLRKQINKLFNEEFELKITIETNLKIVNFLDVTFDLNNDSYQPFSKPNSQPIYVKTKSNHLPNIIKYIPNMISNRISKLSSNKENFDRATVYYNKALKTSETRKNSYRIPPKKITKTYGSTPV